MPNQLLNLLPDSLEKAVLRGVREVLSTDPYLILEGIYQGRAVTFWLGEGDPGEAGDEPGEDELPCLKMRWMGSTGRLWSEGQHREQMVLGFEVCTPGVHDDDPADLCGAVTNAFWPRVHPEGEDEAADRNAAVDAIFTAMAGPLGYVTRGVMTTLGGEGRLLDGDLRYGSKRAMQLTLNLHRHTP
jgi:hypothetical protein